MTDVSVIMATLNSATTLQASLDSIRAQEGLRHELIVIDGGSKDASPRILWENRAGIRYWHSRPDRGIYEAWNGGLGRATGRWVCFLGADDRFSSRFSLLRMVAEGERADAQLVSASVAIVDSGGKVLRIVGRPWDWEAMLIHQVVAHPGMLHRRNLFSKVGPFDPELKVAGDYEWLLRLGPAVRAVHLTEPLVLMGSGGVSRSRGWLVLTETFRIQKRHPEIGQIRALKNLGVAAVKAVGRRLTGRA